MGGAGSSTSMRRNTRLALGLCNSWGRPFRESCQYRYAILDRDGKFGEEVAELLTSSGMNPTRTSAASPWQMLHTAPHWSDLVVVGGNASGRQVFALAFSVADCRQGVHISTHPCHCRHARPTFRDFSRSSLFPG